MSQNSSLISQVQYDKSDFQDDSLLLSQDINAWLARHEKKDMLRFITCGSVDDGKSTLIGRLLHDTRTVPDDEIARVRKLSLANNRVLANGGRQSSEDQEMDFSLFVDGLAAEREQGITIDVAYRYFATKRRKFIVADTPGHEQYTRNMMTGASTAELAIILIDARKGVLTQTRRHSFLVSLIGIKTAVLAINKMDLVNFDEARFQAIVRDYKVFAEKLGFEAIAAIPLSGKCGDNVVDQSPQTPWYQGPSLLQYLETVPLSDPGQSKPFRLSVQGVIRPDLDFRGFTGLISSGRLRPGDPVRVCPSGRESHISRLVSPEGDLKEAFAGQSVTLTLTDEVDISRGDILATPEDPPETADHFVAHLVWMDEKPLSLARSYWLKIGTRTVAAQVTQIVHRIDINSLDTSAADDLQLNEIALIKFRLDHAIAFDTYKDNRETGGFILIDRFSNATVAAGLLQDRDREAHNIHWQVQTINKTARARLKGQRPAVLWLTGLSGAGKSTIANRIETRLWQEGRHSYILDGDNVRHGLTRDLGFSESDRIENIRRVAEVAKLMADAGLIVIVAFISPFRADRDLARGLLDEEEFIEVFIDTPLEIAEQRDPKGLYKKARSGELKNFTGVDSPYEPPLQPEIHIDTTLSSPEAAADQIVRLIAERGLPGVDGEGI